MKSRAIALLLPLFFYTAVCQAAGLRALPRYTIELGHTPTDAVVFADGGIGVYDAFSGSYLKYTPHGRAMESVQNTFLKGGNCLVKNGNAFFFCNSAGASLDMLSENFERKARFKLPSGMKGTYDPTDALVIDGYVYSTDNDNHRIIKTNLANGRQSAVGDYGRDRLAFWYPYALAVDSEGVLYISEVMNTRVQKITQELKFYEFIGKWGINGGEFYRPTGIAVYKGNTLLTADGYTGVIQTFDKDGRFKGVLTDITGKKLSLGSITHIRINQTILAVVDAFNKTIYVYELKEPQ